MKKMLFICVLVVINSALSTAGSEISDQLYLLAKYYESITTNTSIFVVDYSPGPTGVSFFSVEEKGDRNRTTMNEYMKVDGELAFGSPLGNTNLVNISSGKFSFTKQVYTQWGSIHPYDNLLPLIELESRDDKENYFLVAYVENNNSNIEIYDMNLLGPYSKYEKEQVLNMIEMTLKSRFDVADDCESIRSKLVVEKRKWIALYYIILLMRQDNILASDFASSPCLISATDTSLLHRIISIGLSDIIEERNTFSDAMCNIMCNMDVQVIEAVIDTLVDWTKSNSYESCRVFVKNKNVLDKMRESAFCLGSNKDRVVEKIMIIEANVESYTAAKQSAGSE